MTWFDYKLGGTVGKTLRHEINKGRLLPGEPNKTEEVSEKYQKKILCHFFNKGLEWGKEVNVTYKEYDIPPNIGMRDIEDGNLIGMQNDPWMSDVDMELHVENDPAWFYNSKNPVKSAGTLIDMTSKNGRMLLNAPPKVYGTFAPKVKNVLYGMGAWLKINGEAIYGTMPWAFFGKDPTEVTSLGHHGQGEKQGTLIPKYTSKDIRFTQKDNNLYAIVMDWPGMELL